MQYRFVCNISCLFKVTKGLSVYSIMFSASLKRAKWVKDVVFVRSLNCLNRNKKMDLFRTMWVCKTFGIQGRFDRYVPHEMYSNKFKLGSNIYHDVKRSLLVKLYIFMPAPSRPCGLALPPCMWSRVASRIIHLWPSSQQIYIYLFPPKIFKNIQSEEHKSEIGFVFVRKSY